MSNRVNEKCLVCKKNASKKIILKKIEPFKGLCKSCRFDCVENQNENIIDDPIIEISRLRYQLSLSTIEVNDLRSQAEQATQELLRFTQDAVMSCFQLESR